MNPSVFALLELDSGKQLRVSKRDCRTWFDQLVLPEPLSPYMARPRVCVGELLDVGLSLDQIRGHFMFADAESGTFDVGPSAWLYPVSRHWPMGFDWSSHVAREVPFGIAASGGFGSNVVLRSSAARCWVWPKCV